MRPQDIPFLVLLGGAALAQPTAWMAPAADPHGSGEPSTIGTEAEHAVSRVGAAQDGFVLHFAATDTRSGPDRLRGALTLCPADIAPGAPTCWQLRPSGTDPSVWEAALSGPRGASRTPTPTGAAWDEAYRIRRQSGAERVEPSFEIDASDLAAEDAPRSGRNRPDKEAAARDSVWSLKQIRAFDAWDLLRASGAGDGEEGASVTIAHPDTGYREHAEFWDAQESRSRVLFTLGYDFLDEDPSAFDEMDTGGLIPNPGHGTKSGSVIVSPKGKQWPGGRPNEYVSGVAPGAHLVPLRVHRSVVHFFPHRLARALYQAASDDRTLVKKASQVISVSMGGAPSWSLWKAVRFAEQRGVIVLSAAGNEVGFVVWPARFDNTIAVAASNVECGIWEGSSRGSAVDISAPGESVWRAATDPAGVDSVGMGQGTTFATATAAGVAALWLDHHRANPRIGELKAVGGLTEAFREILKSTAWQPGAPPAGVECRAAGGWDTGRFGAGIIDAARALQAPLPAPRTGRAAERTLDELPLFASLFEQAVPPQTVEQRFRALLGLEASRPLVEHAELEGEIAFQYAVDAEVREALAPILSVEPPPAGAFESAREVLRSKDVSRRLREMLTSPS